jgi:hypothetical protein
MYWLLLPADANAQRHLTEDTDRPTHFWVRLWAGLQLALGGKKSSDHSTTAS